MNYTGSWFVMGLFGKSYTQETLVRARERKDIRSIVEHLNSPDLNVRITAAQSIGTGANFAVDPLVRLLDSPDNRMAVEAARALGRIKDPRAVDPLLAYLPKCKLLACTAAYNALVAIGDTRAVEPLIKMLREEMPPHLAFVALVEFGDERALEAMIGYMKVNQQNKEMSINGYHAHPESYQDFIKDLGAFEKDMDDLIKTIFQGIAKVKKQDEILMFYELRRSGDLLLERTAYSVYPNDPQFVEYYIGQLKSTDRDVRLYSVYRLLKSEDIRATEPLLQLLNDPDIEVRNLAARALKKFNVQPLPREKEIVIQIVKIPCKYCGNLVENTAAKCPSCGAPLSPYK